MSDDPEQSAEFLLGRLAHEQEANRKLRALLARAVEALEATGKLGGRFHYPTELIVELREAAE